MLRGVEFRDARHRPLVRLAILSYEKRRCAVTPMPYNYMYNRDCAYVNGFPMSVEDLYVVILNTCPTNGSMSVVEFGLHDCEDAARVRSFNYTLAFVLKLRKIPKHLGKGSRKVTLY
jgi:hypothetical protein